MSASILLNPFTSGMSPLTIGGNPNPSGTSDMGVLLSRRVSGTGQDAHGFRDVTEFLVTTKGYANFDACCTIGSGAAGAYDHVAAFQARPQIHCATITNVYGVYSYPPIYTGSTVASLWHFNAAGFDAQGGAVTVHYGFYCGDLAGSFQAALVINGPADHCALGATVVGTNDWVTYPISGEVFQVVGKSAFSDTIRGNIVPPETARTATADGTGTGTIAAGTKHVTVTCDDANKIIVLPAPVVGHSICIHNGATGYELRSSNPATIAINTGTGVNAESAIPANSTVFITCVTSTAWKGFYMDADGDVVKIEIAAP